MKLLFFDLETTGFGFDKCAIIQFAGILVDIGIDSKLKPVDAINLKMKPRTGKLIDQRALEINGSTVNEILHYPDDKEVFAKFTAFLDKHVDRYEPLDKIKLCGYNSVHFDVDFLRQWFIDNGSKFFGAYFFNDSIDVMCEASRYLLHYRPALINFKLGNIAKVMDIDIDKSALHDGLYDVKLTFKIFKKILDSGNLIMPFDEETATKIFNEQQIAKSQEVKTRSKFDESNAWLEV